MLAWVYEKLAQYLEKEDGATAVEYGIMVALIAAIIIGTVATLGQQILAAFNTVSGNMGF